MNGTKLKLERLRASWQRGRFEAEVDRLPLVAGPAELSDTCMELDTTLPDPLV